ncbi:MAG: DbpA RNA binding domain-containing protein, partial [Chloroflexota bacterium]|nr:DbpA RNA binding domain-containing protein [Chloroflexota bacterium]
PGAEESGALERSRGPRRPARDRSAASEEGMARLFLRVGHNARVRPADLVGAIANEAGLPGNAVGDIDIYDAFSFVEVPEESAEAVLAALNRTTIRGREVRASVARPSSDWQPGGGDDRGGRALPRGQERGARRFGSRAGAAVGGNRPFRTGGRAAPPRQRWRRDDR